MRAHWEDHLMEIYKLSDILGEDIASNKLIMKDNCLSHTTNNYQLGI